ncbi:MAG: hypothetical protein KF901_04630 [Myxococcales bacterium]|nr:hypothetical protein [Myxococcales bacterium]
MLFSPTLPPAPPDDVSQWTIDDAIGAFVHTLPGLDEAVRVAAYAALTDALDPVRSRGELVDPTVVAYAARGARSRREAIRRVSLLAAFFEYLRRAGLVDAFELGRLLLAAERSRRRLGAAPRVLAISRLQIRGELVRARVLVELARDEHASWTRRLRGKVPLDPALSNLVAHMARVDGLPLRLSRLDPTALLRELHASGLPAAEARRRLDVVGGIVRAVARHDATLEGVVARFEPAPAAVAA